MNTDMNGKGIKSIHWGEAGSIHAEGEKTLHLSATYHGDRDEFWVVESYAGKEVARHNCKSIGTIIWTDA